MDVLNQHAATKVNLMTHESVTASYLQWCNILNIGYTYRDLYYDMSVIVYVHFAAAISPVQVYDCGLNSILNPHDGPE